MGLFSAVGSIIGGGKAKKASKKAMRAQVAAMKEGIAKQDESWKYIQGLYDPYKQAGQAGLGAYGNLVGINGNEAQQAAIDQLQTSPFYQSLYRRGEESVLQNASATGGLRGGNTQRSLADFGADTLATTIDRQLAQLGGITNMGVGVAGNLGQFGQANADNVTNLTVGQGQARADDLIRRGSITANQWGAAGGALDQAAAAALAAFGGGLPGGASGGLAQFLGGMFGGTAAGGGTGTGTGAGTGTGTGSTAGPYASSDLNLLGGNYLGNAYGGMNLPMLSGGGGYSGGGGGFGGAGASATSRSGWGTL